MTELQALLWPGADFSMPQGPVALWFGFTLLLWLCAGLYSLSTISKRKTLYWSSFSLAMAGNLLLLLAQDVLGFYLGFALMSLSAYGLVIHSGQSAARRAGRLYLQLAILGELLLFAALLLRVDAAGGALVIADLSSAALTPLTLALLLLGFGLKAGFFPLHIWLPQAHPAAPAPASAVLSGAMIKAGLFGLWQFIPAGDALLMHWLPWLLLLCFSSALFGAWLALLHRKPKVVLAYSSVSQMGYLLLALVLYWSSPADYQTQAVWLLVWYGCHHALLKSALFLAAGAVSSYRLQGWHWLALLWPLVSLTALPLSSGAAVKYGLKEGLGQSSFADWPLLPAVLILGAFSTALLAWHLLVLLRQQHQPANPRLPVTASLGWLLLALASLSMPWWLTALQPLWWQALQPGALFAALWPVVLAALLYGYWLKQGRPLPTGWQDPLSSALGWSLWLKSCYQTKSNREFGLQLPKWRRQERRANRWLNQQALLPLGSSILLAVVLLLWLLS
ncbi:proton-conducting transporter membrane subunit [Alkalimonas sp. NCh-2]|uniref:proton-conducting transporter transmembrane domain-containing protein n=1 Tax=Alkalimonas sp. NCh-2 TaxID=3144846 RepID=UPI0031F69507